MSVILEPKAKLTAQNQITIPVAVRKALRLQGGRSHVRFQILPSRQVRMVLADPKKITRKDPVLQPFLKLLAKDMTDHPEKIRPFPSRLLKKARGLVKGVEVDLDAPLDGQA